MNIYKRGKLWWVMISVDGHRVRRSTGTADKNDAKLIAQEIDRRVRLAKAGLLPTTPAEDAPARITLSGFVEKYQAFVGARRRARGRPEGCGVTTYAFQTLATELGDPILSEITPTQLEQWQAHLITSGRSQNTASTYWACLNTAFKRAVRWGDLKTNPLDATIFQNTLPLVRELWQVRVQDKLLRECPLVFPSPRPKRERPKVLGPRDLNGMTGRFQRLVAKEGLPKALTFHSLRHTFASTLVQQGHSLLMVGEALGHADKRTTSIYAHLTPESIAHIGDGLDWSIEATAARQEAAEQERRDRLVSGHF